VNFDLIDDCLKALAATPYFMFVDLFYRYFCLGWQIYESPNVVVAGTSEINDSKRALAEKVFQLVKGVDTCSNYITVECLLPSYKVFFFYRRKMNCIFTIFF
jgi:hypothetical protein